MKRTCINSTAFTRIYDRLVDERKLSEQDFADFEQDLIRDPKQGDVIPRMEGLRKIRLRSTTKGKRGGFRVDYLDFPEEEILYYVAIYPKSEKEDLNPDEEKIIRRLIQVIKKGVKNE